MSYQGSEAIEKILETQPLIVGGVQQHPSGDDQLYVCYNPTAIIPQSKYSDVNALNGRNIIAGKTIPDAICEKCQAVVTVTIPA